MISQMKIGLVFGLACLAQGNPDAYSTDFSDRVAFLEQWELDDGCAHCKKGLLGGDAYECTHMTPDATTFGEHGMIHSTQQVDPSTDPSGCSAYSSSGHATWKPDLLYGNFTITAKWFPEKNTAISTATGFIGLDSDRNEASITMGFHGDGYLDPKSPCSSHAYQHALYARRRKGQAHNRQYTKTDVSIADNLNTYGLLWSPSKVEWSFNGKVVRTVTDTTFIPDISMNLRLHTRSGYGDKMPAGSTFSAQFTKFEYQPLPSELMV